MLQRISTFFKTRQTARLFLKLWIYSHIILQICRITWSIFNQNLIPEANFFEIFTAFLWGFYFDLPVVAWYLAPVWLWIVLFTAPAQRFPKITLILFALGINLCILLNGIDTGYSQITGKRSGIELLYNMADGGNNLFSYLKVAWMGLLVIIIFNYFLLKRLNTKFEFSEPYYSSSFFFHINKYGFKILALLFWLISARGGFRLKPLAAADIVNFVPAEMAPLVGSTPLQMMHGSGDKVIQYKSDEKQALAAEAKLFLQHSPDNDSFKRPNVVFIIVESLGREYTGFLNNAPYTPFLDSFSKSCLSFNYAYANGTRSMEMASAIFCGVPTLSSSAIINSPYVNNKFPSLFKILSGEGYTSHFFHAAHNQTMGFNSFLKTQGLNNYYGIDEYPLGKKSPDFDGAWGIFDEPYLLYALNCMDTIKKPFFTSVFTLSSHHPYNIPSIYKGKLAKGKLPIHEAIAYTDRALKTFFETAAKKAWFKNTVFVITGDHTSYGETDYFYSESGHYEVPILVFGAGIKPGIVDQNISHAGIGSSILDLIQFPKSFYWPEKSSVDLNNDGYQIHYNPDKGYYYILHYPFTLGVDKNGKVVEFYSRVRNSNKITKLPFEGKDFEKLKNALLMRLSAYAYRINMNSYK